MKTISIKDSEIRLEKSSRVVFVVTLGIILFSYTYGKTVFGFNSNVLGVEEKSKKVTEVIVEQNKYSNLRPQVTGYEEYLAVGELQNGIKESGNNIIIEKELSVESVKYNSSIDRFVASYRGSRINKSYLKVLRDTCKNEKTLELVVAVSVAETGMGRDTVNNSNFWGYFKGGNRRYDPSREQMAQDICKAFSGYYKDVYMNKAKASRYTGNDHTERWLEAVRWAMDKM